MYYRRQITITLEKGWGHSFCRKMSGPFYLEAVLREGNGKLSARLVFHAGVL